MTREERIREVEGIIEYHSYPCKACLDEVKELATAIVDSMGVDSHELWDNLKPYVKGAVDGGFFNNISNDIIEVRDDNKTSSG